MQGARAPHGLEIGTNSDDPIADLAPIRFDLGFSRPAQEPESAALALEMGPAAHEPASLVRQMRELDLELALAGSRAGSEYLKDQAGAVDDLAVPCLLEIALLYRGQRAIDGRDRDVAIGDGRADRFDPSRAEKSGWAGARDGDNLVRGNVEPDRARQSKRLGDACVGRARAVYPAL